MKWSKSETEKLINLFPNNTNKKIAKLLNRSERQIKSKSFKMGLKKTTEHKSKLRSNTNKEKGRDLNDVTLIEIASKYKTRSELQKYDSSVYVTARNRGILDKVCSHMIKIQSRPQLILYYIVSKLFKNEKIIYNTRKIIKPYELDIFIPNHKIAFEYDGAYWHDNNSNDLIKDRLCYENGIELLRISENSRDYINDIKMQMIKNVEIINKYVKVSVKDILKISDDVINSFVSDNIIDDTPIKDVVNKYKSISDFKKNEPKLYSKLVRNKNLYKYTYHLSRKIKRWKNEVDVITEINKYEYLLDFINNSKGCYLHIKRNNLDYLLVNLKRKRRNLNKNK